MADETVNVILRAQGEDEVKRLATQVNQLKEALDKSIASTGASSQATRGIADSYRAAAAQLESAERSLKNLGGTLGSQAITNAGRQATYQMTVLAHAIDDLQYVGQMGFRPILNNLVMISPAIGIIGIGLDTLYRNWSQLESLWQNTSAERAATAMERMAEAAGKIGQTQFQQIEAATEQRIKTGMGSIATELTPDQAEQQKAVKAAMASVDRQQLVRDMADKMIADAGGIEATYTKAEQGKMLNAERIANNPQVLSRPLAALHGYFTTSPAQAAGKMKEEVNQSAIARVEAQAAALVVAAETDEQALADLVESLKGVGNVAVGTAKDLEDAQRSQREEKSERERLERLDIDQRNAVAASERIALSENLTQQGKENEAADAKEIEETRKRNAEKETRKQQRIGRFVEWFGGAYGDQIMEEMMGSKERGEDTGETDDRIRLRLMGKLRGVPEQMKLSVASQIIEGSRNQLGEQEDQIAMQKAIFGPMADPRERYKAMQSGRFGRMGIMQAQMMAQSGMAPAGMNRKGALGRMGIMQQQMMGRMMGMRQGGRMTAPMLNAMRGAAMKAKPKTGKAIDKFASAIDVLTTQGVKVII